MLKDTAKCSQRELFQILILIHIFCSLFRLSFECRTFGKGLKRPITLYIYVSCLYKDNCLRKCIL